MKFAQHVVRHAKWLIIVFISAVAALVVVNYTPLKILENVLYDIRVASFSPVPPSDIVLIAIDDDSYAQIKDLYPNEGWRVPLNKRYLARVLRHIAKGHPQGIGLDVLVDDWMSDAERYEFAKTLNDIHTPVVLITQQTTVSPPPPIGDLVTWADPSLTADGQDHVIRFHETHPSLLKSFASALAGARYPTANRATLPIVFHGPCCGGSDAFLTLNTREALSADPRLFANKTVLIGLVSQPSEVAAGAPVDENDRHLTPARFRSDALSTQAGVVIHAEALATLEDARRIHIVGPIGQCLIVLSCAAAACALGQSRRHWILLSGLVVVAATTLVLLAMALGILLQIEVPILPGLLAATLSFMASLKIRADTLALARSKMESLFGRYVAPAVIARSLAGGDSLSQTAERREITFLVTDVADFSTLVASIQPEDLRDLMNAYFESLIAVLWKHEATVDKLVGDGIFAFFGAPLDQPDHAKRAVACAVELDATAEQFRRSHRFALANGLGQTRIGVATGEALVGNFGGPHRVNYTAYGECAVLAARLQEANKLTGTRLLIAGNAIAKAEATEFELVRTLNLKGMSGPVAAFTRG